jgi:hypothetical protein
LKYKPKFSMLKSNSTSISSSPPIKPYTNRNLGIFYWKKIISFVALNTHPHLHNICLLLIITTLINEPLWFSIICLVRTILAWLHSVKHALSIINSYDRSNLASKF